MPPRVRKPKPTKLKVVTGNPGGRPLSKNEPQPLAGIPTAPPHLSDRGREAWHFWAKELDDVGVLTMLDGLALELLAEAYGDLLDARDLVKFHGKLSTTSNGNDIQHPAVGIANQAWERVKKMLVEFGMTPSARTRVAISEKPKKKKWNL